MYNSAYAHLCECLCGKSHSKKHWMVRDFAAAAAAAVVVVVSDMRVYVHFKLAIS